MSNGNGRGRKGGPERHRGAVTLRREAIPLSTADERLLGSRGRADWKTRGGWRAPRSLSGFVGGFGAMDELFEALTLVQTRKVPRFPVVLRGTWYWGGLLTWMRDAMQAEGKIGAADLELICVTDDVTEAVRHIVDADRALSAEQEAIQEAAARAAADTTEAARAQPNRGRTAPER